MPGAKRGAHGRPSRCLLRQGSTTRPQGGRAEDREGGSSAQRTWRTGEPLTGGRGGRRDVVCTGTIDRPCRTGASMPPALQGRAPQAARHKTHRLRNVCGLRRVVFLLGGWRWLSTRTAPGVERSRAWEEGQPLREPGDDVADQVHTERYRATGGRRQSRPKGQGTRRPLGGCPRNHQADFSTYSCQTATRRG